MVPQLSSQVRCRCYVGGVTRIAADRIVIRAVNGRVVTKYGSTGAGDTSDVTLDNAGNVTEFTISLAGGGLYTRRRRSAGVWSHPSTHGDLDRDIRGQRT